MITKKDFIKFAEILNKTNGYTAGQALYYGKSLNMPLLMKLFIEWFKSENPNFNEDKFREAVLK
jgi:hypothetical protein